MAARTRKAAAKAASARSRGGAKKTAATPKTEPRVIWVSETKMVDADTVEVNDTILWKGRTLRVMEREEIPSKAPRKSVTLTLRDDNNLRSKDLHITLGPTRQVERQHLVPKVEAA